MTKRPASPTQSGQPEQPEEPEAKKAAAAPAPVPEPEPMLMFISTEIIDTDTSINYYYAKMSSVTDEVRGWIEEARADKRFFSAYGYTDTREGLGTAHAGFFQFSYVDDEQVNAEADEFSEEYKHGRAVAKSIFVERPGGAPYRNVLCSDARVHCTIVAYFSQDFSDNQ